jgi:hypothetical protein
LWRLFVFVAPEAMADAAAVGAACAEAIGHANELRRHRQGQPV